MCLCLEVKRSPVRRATSDLLAWAQQEHKRRWCDSLDFVFKCFRVVVCCRPDPAVYERFRQKDAEERFLEAHQRALWGEARCFIILIEARSGARRGVTNSVRLSAAAQVGFGSKAAVFVQARVLQCRIYCPARLSVVGIV